MHKFISFNNQILSAENAFLSAVSSSALYGRGIFTTVAVHDSIPFLWEKHWLRLCGNARKVGMKLDEYSERKIEESLLELIEKNGCQSGRARLTFYDETPGQIWQVAARRKTNFLIQTANHRRIGENFRLTVSPFLVNSTSPLAGVKSCNYLENLLAMEKAGADNFDEAVRINERGEIVSACAANVFWKKNGTIYTPGLETGCLSGTTREFVMENFAVTERAADLTELFEADDIFLTSAGIGIVKVTEFVSAADRIAVNG